MKSSLKLAQKIPFCASFTSKLSRKPLACKTVERNLGPTFYPRLMSIYNNLLESMALRNSEYIKNTCAPPLAQELLKTKEQLWNMGLKAKVNEPQRKLLPLKNYLFKETVYRVDNFYISVVCRVYFGGVFHSKQGWESSPYEKVYRFGQNRFLVYNRAHSLWWNFKRWRAQQVLEFIVKVQSNIFLSLYDSQGSSSLYKREKVNVKYDEDDTQELVATEMVMRSDNQKFDWVLVDLNGILRSKQ